METSNPNLLEQRWTFMVPTALGVTQSTYRLADDGLHFTSDDVFSASETLSWASIRQGCTAAMAGMGGKGAPELPNWVPAQLEWLLLSRTAGSGKAFMRVLPQGGDRDAIVAAIQARLGSGWVGERLRLNEAASPRKSAVGLGRLRPVLEEPASSRPWGPARAFPPRLHSCKLPWIPW